MSMTHKELTRLYRLFDAECARASDKTRNAREYEPYLFIPTHVAREQHQKLLNDLMERAQKLPAVDDVYALLKTHFIEYLGGKQAAFEASFESPSGFIGGITRFIGFMGRKDSRFAEERAHILVRRIGQVDELWNAVRTLIPQTKTLNLKGLAIACNSLVEICGINKPKIPEFFAGLPDSQLDEIATSLDTLAAKATAWSAEVQKVVEGREDKDKTDQFTVDFNIDKYRETLETKYGVSLDELLSWCEDEVVKTREEMFDIAEKIPGVKIPRTVKGVVDALNEFAGPAKTADEMFARCRAYLARGREGTRGYVNMPEEIVRVVPMEEEGRAVNPWGGYRGGCPRRTPLAGEMVLNPDNVPAITDGWIKINALHESYPGHHVQFLRANSDPLPETVREGARSTPLQEGTCLRTERVFEFVFPEDPFYPLFVAYRRHHGATRIKVDLYLHYYNRPFKDSVDLYMEEMDFSEKSAAGQALGQVGVQGLGPGYFTTYYYGMKRIEDLQVQYGYSNKSFTELLFAVSRISLKSFEAFLELSEADRKRFLTGFDSLLPRG